MQLGRKNLLDTINLNDCTAQLKLDYICIKQ